MTIEELKSIPVVDMADEIIKQRVKRHNDSCLFDRDGKPFTPKFGETYWVIYACSNGMALTK